MKCIADPAFETHTLTSTHTAFDDEDYLFEWKVDGIRFISHILNGNIKLHSLIESKRVVWEKGI